MKYPYLTIDRNVWGQFDVYLRIDVQKETYEGAIDMWGDYLKLASNLSFSEACEFVQQWKETLTNNPVGVKETLYPLAKEIE